MSYGGDGGQRVSFNPRLIIAAVIALIGIVTYMTQRQTNPVTGEVQHIAMTVDQEKKLGLQAAPGMADQMGGEVDRGDPRAAMVDQVGRKLVRESDAARSDYVDNFHFKLLNDPKTINAFALPGGQVFITLALYEKLDNEAQLAGVLGHEIGHVVGRHSAEHMAQGQLGGMLATAVGVGASDRDGRGGGAAMAAQMVNQMMQLRYSRGDETRADELGLKYMAQAGYDPTGMLDVMRILKEASSGNRQPEFLATHPLPETRLKDIADQLKKNYPDGVPDTLTKGRALDGNGGGETRSGPGGSFRDEGFFRKK